LDNYSPDQNISDFIVANNDFYYTLRFFKNGSNWDIYNPNGGYDWNNTAAGTFYLNGQPFTGGVTFASNTWYVLSGARTNTTSGAFASNWSYSIGNSGAGAGRNFQGSIGAMYFYNRVLTAAEQTQNYNYLKSRYDI
jgi:hypothetical protein